MRPAQTSSTRHWRVDRSVENFFAKFFSNMNQHVSPTILSVYWPSTVLAGRGAVMTLGTIIFSRSHPCLLFVLADRHDSWFRRNCARVGRSTCCDNAPHAHLDTPDRLRSALHSGIRRGEQAATADRVLHASGAAALAGPLYARQWSGGNPRNGVYDLHAAHGGLGGRQH